MLPPISWTARRRASASESTSAPHRRLSRRPAAAQDHATARQNKQRGVALQKKDDATSSVGLRGRTSSLVDWDRLAAAWRRRTPRPPPALAAPSAISSTPAAARRADEFGQRIDIAADDAIARLHPLDRWNGKTGERRQSALIERSQRPRRPQLCRRYHAWPIISHAMPETNQSYVMNSERSRCSIGLRPQTRLSDYFQSGIRRQRGNRIAPAESRAPNSGSERRPRLAARSTGPPKSRCRGRRVELSGWSSLQGAQERRTRQTRSVRRPP